MQPSDWIAISISALALIVAITAEVRVRGAQVSFVAEVDASHPSRVIVRNTGTRMARKASVTGESVGNVRVSPVQLRPKDVEPGASFGFWTEEEDAPHIPQTIQIRFGLLRRSTRSVKVPDLDGIGRPTT